MACIRGDLRWRVPGNWTLNDWSETSGSKIGSNWLLRHQLPWLGQPRSPGMQVSKQIMLAVLQTNAVGWHWTQTFPTICTENQSGAWRRKEKTNVLKLTQNIIHFCTHQSWELTSPFSASHHVTRDDLQFSKKKKKTKTVACLQTPLQRIWKFKSGTYYCTCFLDPRGLYHVRHRTKWVQRMTDYVRDQRWWPPTGERYGCLRNWLEYNLEEKDYAILLGSKLVNLSDAELIIHRSATSRDQAPMVDSHTGKKRCSSAPNHERPETSKKVMEEVRAACGAGRTTVLCTLAGSRSSGPTLPSLSAWVVLLVLRQRQVSQATWWGHCFHPQPAWNEPCGLQTKANKLTRDSDMVQSEWVGGIISGIGLNLWDDMIFGMIEASLGCPCCLLHFSLFCLRLFTSLSFQLIECSIHLFGVWALLRCEKYSRGNQKLVVSKSRCILLDQNQFDAIIQEVQSWCSQSLMDERRENWPLTVRVWSHFLPVKEAVASPARACWSNARWVRVPLPFRLASKQRSRC